MTSPLPTPPRDRAPLRRRPLPWFLLLLALFVALRVVQSLGAVGSFDDEDGYTLAAAWELAHHPVWPYQAYQLSEWENGSLITVLLCLPFSLIFGPTVFALKMTGLLFSCVTLGGLFLIGLRGAGLAGALLAGLLYIFFPSPVYTYSVTAHGFHPDSMALQTFFIALAAATYLHPAPSRRRFFGLGLLAGLSVYFAYIAAIAVVAGVGPWLLRRLLRLPGPRFCLVPFAAGSALGLLPLLVFNICNDFKGFQIYHGSVAQYLAPTDLGEKLRWFTEQTLTPLSHFANPVDPNDPAYGLFEAAFWAVVIPALLWPYLRWLGGWLRARLGRGLSAPAPIDYLDRVLLWFPLLTVAIFFTSKHPIGPMHMVPVLVVLIGALGVRLGQLWRGGRLPGKGVALALCAGFLAYAAPLHLSDVVPGRLGIALYLDGRNYPLFLYRARDVYDNTRPTEDHFAMMSQEKKLDGVRTLLLTLRPEHAKNDEHLVHHLLVPVLFSPNTLAALDGFLRQPPRTCVDYSPAEAAGLALMQLHLTDKVSRPRMGAWLATVAERAPEQAAQVVEVLGYYLDPTPELLDQLARSGGAQGPSWLRSFAFGLGRAWADRELFSAHSRLCGRDLLPGALQRSYMEGIGFGIARRAVRPLPRYAAANICPRWREAFWRGVARAGPPGPRVLLPCSDL